MDLFCCLAGRPKHATVSHSHSEKLSSTGTNDLPKLNLLEDEGESYQRDLWQLAISEKAQQLDKACSSRSLSIQDQDVAEIQAVFKANTTASPDDFLQALTALYNKNGFAQRMPRIREIFADVQPFISAVNTLVQADMASALVWGSLCLVFAVGAIFSFPADSCIDSVPVGSTVCQVLGGSPGCLSRHCSCPSPISWIRPDPSHASSPCRVAEHLFFLPAPMSHDF